MLLRNVSPLGDIDVPILRRTLTPGEVFEAPDDIAALLLEQPANYETAEEA